MGTTNQRGFTIIEVTLFLAISGLLAVLLLGGWTTMINTQRYKDSVKTLQSFVQQQYNLVYNVENGRNKDLTCTNSTVSQSTINGTPRGQTDCVLMGRYIRIKDGLELASYAIVGQEITNDTSVSDINAILASNPTRVNDSLGLSEDKLTIPWEATIVGGPGDTDPKNYAVAIIRSPISGIVHTYSVTTDNAAMPDVSSELVKLANESSDRTMCLDAGAVLSGGQMGVVIKKFASSQSFVETIPDGDGTC